MIIYTGKFQPFHNGHLSMIEKLVDLFPYEQICVAVIKKTELKNGDAFDKVVDAEWKKKKFLFDSEETCELINSVLQNKFPEKFSNGLIFSCERVRPSASTWQSIIDMFGDNRVWAFTLNDEYDEWEEQKCAFYQSMGDKTIRVPIHKNINGSDLRKFIENKNISALKNLVPEETLKFLIQKFNMPEFN